MSAKRQRHTYEVVLKDRQTHTWMLATIRFNRRSCAGSLNIGLVMQSGPDDNDAIDRCTERLNRLVHLMAIRRARRLKAVRAS